MARRKAAKDPVTQYARDVVDGKVVTGRLVRLACERLHEAAASMSPAPDQGHMRDLLVSCIAVHLQVTGETG